MVDWLALIRVEAGNVKNELGDDWGIPWERSGEADGKQEAAIIGDNEC